MAMCNRARRLKDPKRLQEAMSKCTKFQGISFNEILSMLVDTDPTYGIVSQSPARRCTGKGSHLDSCSPH
eukprot:4299314-Pyramimonas_sp.AAC.1